MAAMGMTTPVDAFGHQSRQGTMIGEIVTTGDHHHPLRVEEVATETEEAVVAIRPGTILIPWTNPGNNASRSGIETTITTTTTTTMILLMLATIGVLLLLLPGGLDMTTETMAGVLPATNPGGSNEAVAALVQVVEAGVVEEAEEVAGVEAAAGEASTETIGEAEASIETAEVEAADAAAGVVDEATTAVQMTPRRPHAPST